ncbi:hypothetical protein BLNAU_22419 [Blattamonas nauphoetae]|uniref:Uncharacterized protein n=1 Tax=Blattamonas nauphoetae TaxID=2049346 RepID=A0ABQ9WTK9_9EUKA|nr:hypothetical protein BLNAU_22419 [Blattamonas nauphoetae]
MRRFGILCASHSPPTLSPLSLHSCDFPHSTDTSEDDSEGSDDVVAQLMAVLDPCSTATHTFTLSLRLPSPHLMLCVLVAVHIDVSVHHSPTRIFRHTSQTLRPTRVQPISLTHSLPNQPQLRLTTPPSRHPPPLTQPALRRLGRLSPIFTCGTRGGSFVGSDSESEMTLGAWERVFRPLCLPIDHSVSPSTTLSPHRPLCLPRCLFSADLDHMECLQLVLLCVKMRQLSSNTEECWERLVGTADIRSMQPIVTINPLKSVAESGPDDRQRPYPFRLRHNLGIIASTCSSHRFGIAHNSLTALFNVIQQDPPAFAHLPSPIFPSSSPHQQYSGLSFLAALPEKLRIVFSEFQTNLPADLSHLPKYIQLIKDDPFIVTHSLQFCVNSCDIPLLLLNATPPIEVDSEIIQAFILFVKEALTSILVNISNIDNLFASLLSDSSPTTPLVSGVDIQMADTLKILRNSVKEHLRNGWIFVVNLTHIIADPHKSSFQTIVVDDPSFPDLILNSLKLDHKDIRRNTLMAITNITNDFPSMNEQFITANFVSRMFETVDFVSLPLSESETLYRLTRFLSIMLFPIGDDVEAQFEQYPLIRVSVFEPAKQFITFIFHNSDKLILNDKDKTLYERHLYQIHNHIKNMELRSDEHDADIVSELVKWEVRTIPETENEANFRIVFVTIMNRTCEWNRDKRERQKRREVRLREEGWDDAFELRVVGIEVDTNQTIQIRARRFRIEQTYNADRR